MFERADDLFRCWINLARKNALFQLTTSALMGLLTGSLKELHLPSFFLQKPPKNGLSPAKLNFARDVTWNGVWLKRHRVVALASNHASVHSHPHIQEHAFASTVFLQGLGESLVEKHTEIFLRYQ